MPPQRILLSSLNPNAVAGHSHESLPFTEGTKQATEEDETLLRNSSEQGFCFLGSCLIKGNRG